jgi:hypothetical protein
LISRVKYLWIAALTSVCVAAVTAGTQSRENLKLRVNRGLHSPAALPFYIKVSPSLGVTVTNMAGYSLEPGEGLRDGAWQTIAGNSDIDGMELELSFPRKTISIIQEMHIIWADLIEQSDADTVRRLTSDASFREDDRRITFEMDATGTRGFTMTIDQLLRSGSIWVPSLDVYLTSNHQPFTTYEQELAPWKGLRVLDKLHAGKEATYDQYASLWEDMGSPAYMRSNQPKPGHIVCLSWDSAIPKFGIDRGGGVWNDYGNPDHFRFWFGIGDLENGILNTWRSQKLNDGLPFPTTTIERDGLRYEVEQLAYPLEGLPPQGNGDIAMVLMQKLRVTDLKGEKRVVTLTLNHQRALPNTWNENVELEQRKGEFLLEDSGRRQVLLSVRGADGVPAWSGVKDYQDKMRRAKVTVFLEVPANGSREIIVKLPSQVVSQGHVAILTALDYAAARNTTARLWQQWLDRGASFTAPEKVVNDLYRGNLWHALRLPRRHGGPHVDEIDLPYSNFAYSQTGTPWPINQAIYVDYMIYDLRGYFDVSDEELTAILRNNEEPDGHVGGIANWFVYTPAMLFSIARHYELSGDRSALDNLMPRALKILDWLIASIKKGEERTGFTAGLVEGPLNDITGSGVWAFNQAYLFAGLSEFGKVLQEIGHTRATECVAYANQLRESINSAFRYASTRSRWLNFAITRGRLTCRQKL